MVVLDLISKSGLFGNLILLFITGLSIISWTLIIINFFSSKKEIKNLRKVHRNLKEISNLQKLFFLNTQSNDSSLKNILHKFHLYLTSQPTSTFENTQNFLDKEIELELYEVEKGLQAFSLISQVSPFLGLLGTVWGIMNAFYSIGAQGSANISVVAPGIAEALITTVWGLLVAIPATIAYFYFDHQFKKIENLLYSFSSKVLKLDTSNHTSKQNTL